MIVSALMALAVQAAAPAAPAQTQPVGLPPTYIDGVKKCLAELPEPSGKLYANLAEWGRGPEADAAIARITAGTASKYSECLTNLKEGVDEVRPKNDFQLRQQRFTRADVDQRIANREQAVQSIITLSRDEFREQPARYWAALSIGSDLDWLGYDHKPMASVASKCGTFKVGEALLPRYQPAVTNATLKRMYAYIDCVDPYYDELYSESGAIDRKLRLARQVAFYEPYVCGTAPPNHCVDRAQWQAVAAKLTPARVAKLNAMAARIAPQLEEASKANDEIDRFKDHAEALVDGWNKAAGK